MRTEQNHSEEISAVVAGGGPVGLAAAAALAHVGIDSALVAPAESPARRDTRSTALFGGSLELLRHLGAWPALEAVAAPLVGLRLIDDTGGLLRAPETLFRASELGLDCFGWNIENVDLTRVLLQLVADSDLIDRRHGSVTGLEVYDDRIAVRSDAAEGAAVCCRLLVGADGRGSVSRRAAGITTTQWSYPQSALAVRFEHTRPHGNISTEFHRRGGPLTTVPLPGNQSSLVWVDTPETMADLMALEPDAFCATLEDNLQGLLGGVVDAGPRSAFPLSGLSVASMGRQRVALVGEAAHVLPPIGAQGLNLGLRDVAWIAELAGAARRRGEDIGSAELLAAYDDARRADVTSRTMAVDLFNRSLVADMLPLDLLRGAGLIGLDLMPWLRRLVMREGITPSNGDTPALLRPPPS